MPVQDRDEVRCMLQQQAEALLPLAQLGMCQLEEPCNPGDRPSHEQTDRENELRGGYRDGRDLAVDRQRQEEGDEEGRNRQNQPAPGVNKADPQENHDEQEPKAKGLVGGKDVDQDHQDKAWRDHSGDTRAGPALPWEQPDAASDPDRGETYQRDTELVRTGQVAQITGGDG